jgi:hypothetical protein
MYNMNDGRQFTNYDSSGSMNSRIKITNNIQNNEQYRSFMTRNAINIMNKNATNYETHSYDYIPKVDPKSINALTKTSNTPYIFHSINDIDQPYGYENNKTKSMYLSMQQIKANEKNKYGKRPY